MDPIDEQLASVGPQIIFAMDASGRCTLSAGPGLAGLGLQPSELVGVDLPELYAEAPDIVANLQRVLGGESFATEGDEVDGRVLQTYFQPLLNDEGEVEGALGVTTDVTDQLRASALATAARERAQDLSSLSTILAREVNDLHGLVELAVRSVTGRLAQFGALWMHLTPDLPLEPLATWHRDASLRGLIRQAALGLKGRPGWLDSSSSAALIGPMLFGWTLDDLDPTSEPELLELTRRGGSQVGIRLPLHSRGRVIGFIDLARPAEEGAFTEAETTFGTEMADRCALAIANALLLAEQRQASEELVKFKALADASQDMIAIADNTGRALYLNPVTARSGLPLDESDLWETGLRLFEGAGEGAREALERGERWTGALEWGHEPDLLRLRAEVLPLWHPDTDDRIGTAWIATDVTALSDSQAALRRTNEDLIRARSLVETSPDFIAIADLGGRVEYLNPAGRALIDLDPELDVTACQFSDFLTPQGSIQGELVIIPAVLTHGRWSGESTLRHRSGRGIPVALTTFLILDPETGEPAHVVTIQRDTSEEREAEATIRELGRQREALLERLVEAQEAERGQIAADVHDDSVQALAAVDLRLGLLARQLAERAPDLLELLHPLQENVQSATERLRSLLFDLETPDADGGLASALMRSGAQIFENTATTFGITGSVDPELPESTLIVAYRIAREAMVNVVKHAQATRVQVTISKTPNGLLVTVRDDGVGPGASTSSSPPGHFGITSMIDRASLSGGSCEIHAGPEGGTVVELWLPVAWPAGPLSPEPEAVVRATEAPSFQPYDVQTDEGSEDPGGA